MVGTWGHLLYAGGADGAARRSLGEDEAVLATDEARRARSVGLSASSAPDRYAPVMRLRTFVSRLALRVAAWGSDVKWQDDPMSGVRAARRVRPVRFENTTHFENFYTELRALSLSLTGASEHIPNNDKVYALDGFGLREEGEPRYVTDRIAHATDRRRLSFMSDAQSFYDFPVVYVSMHDEAGRPSVLVHTDARADEEYLHQLKALVDRHTVELERREVRRGVQLVDPFDLPTQQAQEFTASVERKAAKLGGGLGILGGILVVVAEKVISN